MLTFQGRRRRRSLQSFPHPAHLDVGQRGRAVAVHQDQLGNDLFGAAPHVEMTVASFGQVLQGGVRVSLGGVLQHALVGHHAHAGPGGGVVADNHDAGVSTVARPVAFGFSTAAHAVTVVVVVQDTRDTHRVKDHQRAVRGQATDLFHQRAVDGQFPFGGGWRGSLPSAFANGGGGRRGRRGGGHSAQRQAASDPFTHGADVKQRSVAQGLVSLAQVGLSFLAGQRQRRDFIAVQFQRQDSRVGTRGVCLPFVLGGRDGHTGIDGGTAVQPVVVW